MSDLSEYVSPKPGKRRRRVRQTVGLEERLAASAGDDRERARSLPPGRERAAASREADRRSDADDRMAHDAIIEKEDLKVPAGGESERRE